MGEHALDAPLYWNELCAPSDDAECHAPPDLVEVRLPLAVPDSSRHLVRQLPLGSAHAVENAAHVLERPRRVSYDCLLTCRGPRRVRDNELAKPAVRRFGDQRFGPRLALREVLQGEAREHEHTVVG